MHMSGKKDLDVLMGDPKKAILSMVLPFFLAAAVVQINSFVDTFWISGLGNVAGAAVSTIVPVYGLIMCAGLGIGVGATTTIAYRLGQGDKEGASRLAMQAFMLGVVCAIIGSVLAFVLYDPIIDLMGAGEVREASFSYLLPYLVMSPALLCVSILGAILRSEGAAKKSTVVQMSSAIFNMIIDPILIYGLGMGIMGAGLSTCISALLALILGLSWYARKKMVLELKLKNLRPCKTDALEVLDVGGPRTIQSIISNLTDLFQRVFLIIAGGTNAVMFYNYAWRYIGLVQLPAGAFDTAMVPVCSAANGQNNPEKMRDGFLFVLRAVILCALIFTVVLFVIADPLVSILTYEESMHELKGTFVWTLRVSAFLLPFSALMGLGSSMLQALKRSKVSMNYYFIWGFVKLGMYAVACTISFEAIIYCMVLVHWFGGICLVSLAYREFRKRFPDTPLFIGRSTKN